MASFASDRLRVAAINFLNPAPLMWDFEHAPRKGELAERYRVQYTQPSLCADELLAGQADLGLIPIASLTDELRIVPGCTIASPGRVRSIQLIVKNAHASTGPVDGILRSVRSIAVDTASRSSLAYVQILFRRFVGSNPEFRAAAADVNAMLASADAALLIGDPALLALEARQNIEQSVGPCLWLDVAHEWQTRTQLPWVAAVWAVRPDSLAGSAAGSLQLIADLQQSRDNGLLHVDALVREWTGRIALPPETIRHYLTRNIQYTLTPDCMEAVRLFRRYAAEYSLLQPLPELRFL